MQKLRNSWLYLRKVPDKTVSFTCKIPVEQLAFGSGFIASHNAWFFRVHSMPGFTVAETNRFPILAVYNQIKDRLTLTS